MRSYSRLGFTPFAMSYCNRELIEQPCCRVQLEGIPEGQGILGPIVVQAFLNGEAEEKLASVFDAPEAEPSELFINPFACNTSPLLWRELQVYLAILHPHTYLRRAAQYWQVQIPESTFLKNRILAETFVLQCLKHGDVFYCRKLQKVVRTR